MTEMRDCPQFQTCNANLCPLDPDLGKRNWFAIEPVCKKNNAPRWVRKQRSIQKRQTKTWFTDHPWNSTDLINASQPRKLSEEQIAKMRENLKKARNTPQTPKQ